MLINFNDSITESEKNIFNFQNRAFLYGDGIFETAIFRNEFELHTIILYHWDRCNEACDFFEYETPKIWNLDYLKNQIIKLIELNHFTFPIKAKWNIWRDADGTYAPSNRKSKFLIQISPYIKPQEMVSELVKFSLKSQALPSPWSQFKTSQSMPYILAGMEMQDLGVNDMIILDLNKNIAECISSNLFWISENKIYTPSLLSGCLAGTMRKRVLNWAIQNNISVLEGLYQEKKILEADFVFSTNTIGLKKIFKIHETSFNESHEIWDKLTFEFN